MNRVGLTCRSARTRGSASLTGSWSQGAFREMWRLPMNRRSERGPLSPREPIGRNARTRRSALRILVAADVSRLHIKKLESNRASLRRLLPRFKGRVLIALLALVSVFGNLNALADNTAVVPEPRTYPANWMSRHEALVRRARSGGVDILFLGDSIMEGWSWPVGEVSRRQRKAPGARRHAFEKGDARPAAPQREGLPDLGRRHR